MAMGIVLASASLWLVGAQSARAATFVCNDFTGNSMTADVPGTVQVPADGQCNTNGKNIGGSVLVGKRAKLFVETPTIIKGSIVADAPKQLNVAQGSEVKGSVTINGPSQPTTANPDTFGGFVCPGKVGGSVTLQNLTAGRWVIGEDVDSDSTGEGYDFPGPGAELTCKNSNTIGGSVNIIGNKGVQTVEISGNKITGSVTIQNNTVANEALHVETNTIGGGLACSGNANTNVPSVPMEGAGNTASSKTGQCSGF
jgi:hypothetical protein